MSRATIQTICATCAARSPLVIEQRVEKGQLKWFECFACPCGHGFEASGKGKPPEGMRKRILQQSGEASLYVSGVNADQEMAMATLVCAIVETPADLVLEKIRRDSNQVFMGSATEMLFLKNSLEGMQIEAKLVQHFPTILDE